MRFVSGALGFVTIASFAFSGRPALGQGGLPPNAGQTIREGMSKPRITGIQAVKGAAGPGGCFVRDAALGLVGLNFGATASGRRVMASHRGVPIGAMTITSWTVSRIEVKLSLGVDLEGENVSLDIVDSAGASATLAGGTPITVCYRDQTVVSGALWLPACSSDRRTFRFVASGPARMERSLAREPHATSVPYRFASVPFGSWTVTVEETTPPLVRGIAPGPPGAIPHLAGCDAPSLGFDPRSRTVVVSKPSPRATDVNFVELMLSLPHPGPEDFRRAFGSTPTPGGPVGAIPPPHLSFPTLTPTPTPSR